jgi:hypothetical protein
MAAGLRRAAVGPAANVTFSSFIDDIIAAHIQPFNLNAFAELILNGISLCLTMRRVDCRS